MQQIGSANLANLLPSFFSTFFSCKHSIFLMQPQHSNHACHILFRQYRAFLPFNFLMHSISSMPAMFLHLLHTGLMHAQHFNHAPCLCMFCPTEMCPWALSHFARCMVDELCHLVISSYALMLSTCLNQPCAVCANCSLSKSTYTPRPDIRALLRVRHEGPGLQAEEGRWWVITQEPENLCA